MLAFNQKLGQLAKELAKSEAASDQEISCIFTKLPCKFESVSRGGQQQCGDEKFEEARSLNNQVLPLTQQLEALSDSMEQSDVSHWCAEFTASTTK